MNISGIKPVSKEVVERMKALRKLPPPTLEIAIAQSKATARIRKEMKKYTTVIT